MKPKPTIPLWQTISRAAGLGIVLALLVVYLAGWPRNPSVTLGFLGVASALIGLPAGLQFLQQRNGRSNGHSS